MLTYPKNLKLGDWDSCPPFHNIAHRRDSKIFWQELIYKAISWWLRLQPDHGEETEEVIPLCGYRQVPVWGW
jgi:hypothetical protein